MAVMANYTWPGNVRELKNAMEHAVVKCQSAMIRASDLPPELTKTTSSEDETEELDRDRVLAVLQKTNGNRTRAARALGISRATLYRRLDQLGIASKHPSHNEDSPNPD